MDSYANSVVRNIGKVFILPNNKSNAYRNLLTQVLTIMNQVKLEQMNRQQAIEALNAILSGLKRIAPRADTVQGGTTQSAARAKERISTVVQLLNPINLVPKSILDIGAGAGDITTALRNYYQLPEQNVFAIDQKLPEILDVTAITYDNDGRIPLPDASIDLITLFVVLHHIPPDARTGIMSEIARVLAPNGAVIIREHDNDSTHDFYVFLDIIHLFWYLASGETPDPLYLMSRAETQGLFQQVGLVSRGYTTYHEPNPQRLYHEMFVRNTTQEIVPNVQQRQQAVPNVQQRQEVTPNVQRQVVTKNAAPVYRFADNAAQTALQTYINKFKQTPASYQAFLNVIPRTVQQTMRNKYSNTLIANIAQLWPEIIQNIGLDIILRAVAYSSNTNGVYYLTAQAINAAINDTAN